MLRNQKLDGRTRLFNNKIINKNKNQRKRLFERINIAMVLLNFLFSGAKRGRKFRGRCS